MKEISIHEININPVTMFGKEWCLIAAGNEKNGYNTMTVAWGQLGAVWDRHTPEGKMIIPTATVFIRPQRYTKEFLTGKNILRSAPLVQVIERLWHISGRTQDVMVTKSPMQG